MQEFEPESRVQQELKQSEPVDQDEFVRSFESSELNKKEVLGALRGLMEQDKVSYTLDYNLQTQEDD